ncbi:MAG TPA: lysophospholipid acyltransferase family protein [Candidatus Acidoferrales bacterium]
MIRTVMVLTFVALALIFVQPLLILWTLLTGDPNFMYRTFMRALRVVLRLAGIHVRVEGLQNIPSGVCVFASNHASNLDPVALVPNIPRRVALLAKKEVFRIPILSKAITLAKLIPVDRADKEAAAESVDIAVEYLKEGLSFCVFPEGTRSRDGRLLPFKKGTFLMAIRAAAWVVPVSLAGTQRLMRKGDWTIHPGEVVVRYGPAVNATEYAEDQRDELRQRVQKLVAAGLPENQKPSAGN